MGIEPYHFELEIDYAKNTPDPSRVFRAMINLIQGCEQIDIVLARSIDTSIQSVLIIESIETGSIRTILSSAIQSIDDDALKTLDWKKAVGAYLVKGKAVVLRFLQDKKEITSREELVTVVDALHELAESTDVRHIPAYEAIKPKTLLPGIQKIAEGLSQLNTFDVASYKSKEDVVVLNAEFSIVPEKVESLLTSRSVDSVNTLILKVKRPDYLGDSQWDFRHGNRSISAKITDKTWLAEFHGRRCELRPGDSLRAEIRTSVKYGFDYDVVSESYEIVKVFEILPSEDADQLVL